MMKEKRSRGKGKSKGRHNKNIEEQRLRIVIIGICTILGFLIIRLGWIMLVKGELYSAKAEVEWNSQISVTAKRGDILDRNETPLVTSANVYRIDLDLKALDTFLEDNEISLDEACDEITAILEIDRSIVYEALNTKNEDGELPSYVPLIRAINKDKADRIEELELFGVMVSRDTERYYPNGKFLANTLGSINSEGDGLTGIELQYDDYLAGIAGMKIGGFDNAGNKIPFEQYEFTPPINGKDALLTIDGNIQSIAEKVAEKGLQENVATGVHILVMNPNTGEILAMVNKPDYDPNNPYDGYENFAGDTENDQIQNMWRNGIVSDTFEPGSTFKNITMIAALEEGITHEGEIFECNGGVHFGDDYVKCWNLGGHGKQTLPEILKNSCNVGFMVLGERLGIETLNKYIDKLGFGRVTGVDLPGEAEGIVKASEDVSPIDLATISFGQTNTVTVMQIMQSFNAIANGGDLIQPHIMKEISYLDDKTNTRIVEESFKPKITKDVLSEEKTSILRGYLERTATQDGPAGSFVKGYDVGLKTGTAEKPDPINGGYSGDKYIASAIALAPVDAPEITAFISVDEPSTGIYYGGQVASPLMKELLGEIFKYMDSPMAEDKFTVAKNVIVPDVRNLGLEEAEKILLENGLTYTVEGNGDTITSMDIYPGVSVKDGTEIKVYAKSNGKIEKEVIVPDLKGTTAEFATSVLNNLGLKCTIEGQGVVYHQDIAQGTVVKKNTNVKLTLKEGLEY